MNLFYLLVVVDVVFILYRLFVVLLVRFGTLVDVPKLEYNACALCIEEVHSTIYPSIISLVEM